MKGTAVALLLMALVATAHASSFYFTADDLQSDEELWDLYGRWCAHHGVVREPGRFATFKGNAHRIHRKQRHPGELMVINVFGDKSFDDIMNTTSCLKFTTSKLPPELEQLPVIDLELVAATRPLDLPDKVDWRAIGAVTDVKRQGGCGCCWAFATAATVEGYHAIKTGSRAVSLSAQFLLDCTHLLDGASDCSGGNRYKALALIRLVGGIPFESVYPYKGVMSTCDTKFSRSANISSWFRLKQYDVTNMKRSVALQPTLVAIGVDEDFVDWDPTVRGNVYYGPGQTSTLTHAVLIVGYDFDNLGDMYWIVKNSWGPQWGDHGYIFISAEANTRFVGKTGVAGILTNGIYLT